MALAIEGGPIAVLWRQFLLALGDGLQLAAQRIGAVQRGQLHGGFQRFLGGGGVAYPNGFQTGG